MKTQPKLHSLILPALGSTWLVLFPLSGCESSTRYLGESSAGTGGDAAGSGSFGGNNGGQSGGAALGDAGAADSDREPASAAGAAGAASPPVSAAGEGGTFDPGGVDPGAAGAAGSAGAPPSTNGCTTLPCQNGTECTPGAGQTFSCDCGTRYVGPTCEYRKFAPLGIKVSALSQDGWVAVGQACDGPFESCPPVKVSTGGGKPLLLPVPMDPPAVPYPSSCNATIVNGNGTWVGGACGSVGIIWDGVSGTGNYVYGRTPEEALAFWGVNSDASVIVGQLNYSDIMRRVLGELVALMPLNPAQSATATAVSNDGALLVGRSGGHPFGWSAATGIQALAELPNQPPDSFNYYEPADISASKAVIVGTLKSRGTPTALRWSASGVQAMGVGTAVGTNLDGSFVVGDTVGAACLWDAAGKMQLISDWLGMNPDLAGWTLRTAVGISDDGKVIVGLGYKDENQMGWVIHR